MGFLLIILNNVNTEEAKHLQQLFNVIFLRDINGILSDQVTFAQALCGALMLTEGQQDSPLAQLVSVCK